MNYNGIFLCYRTVIYTFATKIKKLINYYEKIFTDICFLCCNFWRNRDNVFTDTFCYLEGYFWKNSED